MTSGTCWVCGNAPARHGITTCSPLCAKRRRSRNSKARKRFLARAARPVTIEGLAKHFRITVDEARRRAEHDIAVGHLIGLFHDGLLIAASTPKLKGDVR